MKWPTKKEREDLEVKGFIEAYRRLSHGRSFVVESEGECPDRIVKDINTSEQIGIELTSVYMDDRSVPDAHMKDGNISVPYDANQIEQYEKRILGQIIDKVCKARSHYKKDFPLILSVYVNEYISLRMGIDYWREFASRYDKFFDCLEPFDEIVFWPLPSPPEEPDLVISAKLSK